MRRGGTSELSWYDDPPNQNTDCPGTIRFTTTLFEENTTVMMVGNGKSQVAAFSGDFRSGVPFAYRNVHANELHFDYQKVQFKFKWKEGVTEEQRHPITYLLLFQPEDNPDTQGVDESIENAEILETITWNGRAPESRVFHIDPDERKNGVDGQYRLLPIEIKPDDGVAGVVGDMVPSNNGATGEKHFVSPKKSTEIPNDYVTLKAEGPTKELFESLLEWEGGEAVPNEPLKRRIKRDTTGKTVVKVKVKNGGQEAAKVNAWVVWCDGGPPQNVGAATTSSSTTSGSTGSHAVTSA